MTNQKPDEQGFKREQRYIVLKIDDVHQLDLTDQKILDQICSRVSWNRKQSGKKGNSYVVVNEDEPYAEQVWKLIEQFQTGKPLSQEAPDEGLLLTETVTKILEKWFHDPIDEPCAYCEATKDIISKATPLIEAKFVELYETLRVAEGFLDRNNGRNGTAKELCLICHSNEFGGLGIKHAYDCPIEQMRKTLNRFKYIGNKTEGE